MALFCSWRRPDGAIAKRGCSGGRRDAPGGKGGIVLEPRSGAGNLAGQPFQAAGSAGFPARRTNWGLESPQNRPAGMPALQGRGAGKATWKRPKPCICGDKAQLLRTPRFFVSFRVIRGSNCFFKFNPPSNGIVPAKRKERWIGASCRRGNQTAPPATSGASSYSRPLVLSAVLGRVRNFPSFPLLGHSSFRLAQAPAREKEDRFSKTRPSFQKGAPF